jgi:hypothetical protein
MGALRCVTSPKCFQERFADARASNLCIDGGYDICAEMYNKNILTPLKTFITKVRRAMSYFERVSHTRRRVRFRQCSNSSCRLRLRHRRTRKRSSTNLRTMSLPLYGAYREFSLVFGILVCANRCRETSNKALNAINDIQLVPFLMSFLASKDSLQIAPVLAAGKLQPDLCPTALLKRSSPVPLCLDRRQLASHEGC